MKTHITNFWPIRWFPTGMLVLHLLLFSSCKKEEQPILDEGAVEVTVKEVLPDAYFEASLKAYADGDYKECATSIRKAVEVMEKLEFKESAQQGKISNSIAELKELEANVAVRKFSGIEDLNYFFARAGSALAGYHVYRSQTFDYHLESAEAGEELENALASIEKMVKYFDHQFDGEEQLLLASIHDQARLLKQGEAVNYEEVEAAIQKLSDHLQKWNNDIEVVYRDKRNMMIK